MRILIVEDELNLARHLRRVLVRSGHEVSTGASGPEAVGIASATRFDLIVLDLGLPGFDGFEVLRRLGPPSARPRVLMLTSRGEVPDRVEGLRAGADDFLVKPFAMEEVLARVDALGRRAVLAEVQDGGGIPGVVLDVVHRRVLIDGQPVELSPRECELLQIFLSEPKRVFSRSELFERIWSGPMAMTPVPSKPLSCASAGRWNWEAAPL
jgi:DNA-binding response OmpR family regulator